MKSFATSNIVAAMIGASLFLFAGKAHSQTAKDLVGWWTVVSVVNEQEGKKTDVFGPDPKGYALFDGNHFAFAYTRVGLPKFASGNRTSGTAEENKAVVQGSLSYFGAYAFSEANKTLTLRVEASTFPNWVGDTQKRAVTLNGNELRLVNQTTSVGAGTNVVVFRRGN